MGVHNSSGSANDHAKMIVDRSGAFPQMPFTVNSKPQMVRDHPSNTNPSGSQNGTPPIVGRSISNGSYFPNSVPQSPRHHHRHHSQLHHQLHEPHLFLPNNGVSYSASTTPRSASPSNNTQQTSSSPRVNLPPKLPHGSSHGNGAFPILASSNAGIPRSSSRNQMSHLFITSDVVSGGSGVNTMGENGGGSGRIMHPSPFTTPSFQRHSGMDGAATVGGGNNESFAANITYVTNNAIATMGTAVEDSGSDANNRNSSGPNGPQANPNINGNGSEGSFHRLGGFVSTPSNGSVGSSSMGNSRSSGRGNRGSSRARGSSRSKGSEKRILSNGSVGTSVGSNSTDIMESVKQQGMAKRKRKEYAKDGRYASVKKVVDGERI